MINQQMSYYEILELAPEATRHEIEAAYRSAKETYSTSNSALYSMFNQEEALQLHRLIEEAYKTLTNPDLKLQYDLQNGFYDGPEIIDQPTINSLNSIQKENNSSANVRDGVIFKEYEVDSRMEERIKKLDDCSGLFLQQVRKYKNISIDELANFSKISKTNILNIENEDIENLPARVFTRGFASQLARLLGLDSNKFANKYIEAIDEKKRIQS